MTGQIIQLDLHLWFVSNPFVQGGAEHEEGAGHAKEEVDCANRQQQQQQNGQQLPEGDEDPKEKNPQDTGSENKGKT